MEKFIVRGGKKLKGTVKVKGAKNSALKILAAALLTDQEINITNVPQIEDVFRQIELLRGLGVEVVSESSESYRLGARSVQKGILDPKIAEKLKGSIVMAGPLLARFGQANFPHAGGCVIGQRPRDMFVAGFEALGAKIKTSKQGYFLTAKKLTGAKFVFPKVSVTASETMILAAVLAKGKTTLINTACEPEIPHLANFLNGCGAKIKGAGTPFVEIEGVKSLSGGNFKVLPDRIEAGCLVMLGLATGSPIKVANMRSEHLEVLWSILERAGADLKISKDSVEICRPKKLKAVDIKTHEYPGFVTDWQAPFTVLMTQAKGQALIHETIFDGRLFYTDMLNQMGANIIMCDPHRVIVQGPSRLYGRRVVSPDLRAGLALVMAALVAQGTSEIENIYQIDRGYEKIEERLQKLGADIKRVSVC